MLALARALFYGLRPGKTKQHLRVRQLWVQDAVRQRKIRMEKVLGTDNPADMYTKHLDSVVLNKLMKRVGMVPRGGRADSAPKLVKANGAEDTFVKNDMVQFVCDISSFEISCDYDCTTHHDNHDHERDHDCDYDRCRDARHDYDDDSDYADYDYDSDRDGECEGGGGSGSAALEEGPSPSGPGEDAEASAVSSSCSSVSARAGSGTSGRSSTGTRRSSTGTSCGAGGRSGRRAAGVRLSNWQQRVFTGPSDRRQLMLFSCDFTDEIRPRSMSRSDIRRGGAEISLPPLRSGVLLRSCAVRQGEFVRRASCGHFGSRRMCWKTTQ